MVVNLGMAQSRNKFITVLFLILTILYIILSFLLHVEVTALVVGNMKWLTGNIVPRNYSVEASIAIITILILYIYYRSRKGVNRTYTFLFLYCYLIFVYYFYLVLSLHAVEYVHFIQYFGLVFLIGWTFDPDRKKFLYNKILFAGVVIGILDEIFQFYIVAPGHKYLDFNDFLINTLGTVGGLLLYYGFYPLQSAISNKRNFWVTKRFFFTSSTLIIILILIYSGIIEKTPPYPVAKAVTTIDGNFKIYLERIPGWLGHWRAHFVSGYFYNLSPAQGIILIIIAVSFFSLYDPAIISKFKIGKKITEHLK